MLKNFEREANSKEPIHRPAEKLLAVLAVMREVRVQDRRFLQTTESQSLVPLEYRKQLLDGSIAALFARKQRLFDSFVNALGKDPEEDVSRLLGLLLWLSYDCGMDARELNLSGGKPEERRERLLNLAKLFEIAVASGKDKEVFKEAEQSIWRTSSESFKVRTSNWIKYHQYWAEALNDVLSPNIPPLIERSPRIGDIGIANREAVLKPRLILGFDDPFVRMVEFGKDDFEIIFLRNYVNSLEMPVIQEKFLPWKAET